MPFQPEEFLLSQLPVLDQTAEISLPISCLVMSSLVGFFRWMNHDRTAQHFSPLVSNPNNWEICSSTNSWVG